MTTPIHLQWVDDGDGGTCAAVEFDAVVVLRLYSSPSYSELRDRLKIDWSVFGWNDQNPAAMGVAPSIEAGQRRAEKAARGIVREMAKALRGKP